MRARNPVIFHLIPGGAVLALHWLGSQGTRLRRAVTVESTNQLFWQDWALLLTKQRILPLAAWRNHSGGRTTLSSFLRLTYFKPASLNSKRLWPSPVASVLQRLVQILWDQNWGKYELVSFQIQEDTELGYFALWEIYAARSSAEDIATPTTTSTSLKEKVQAPRSRKTFQMKGPQWRRVFSSSHD